MLSDFVFTKYGIYKLLALVRIIKLKLNRMKNGIPSEKYYFLLEWKDVNMEEFISMYGERRMCDLNTYELKR